MVEFSPLVLPQRESDAATASYRLLPHIVLDESNPIPPHLATRFKDSFSSGVINVDPDTKEVSVDKRAVHGETMSREVLLAGYVKLARVRDHFICASLFICVEMAIRVMREKISALKAAAEALRAQGDPERDIQMADT